jgi:hypothetical protein
MLCQHFPSNTALAEEYLRRLRQEAGEAAGMPGVERIVQALIDQAESRSRSGQDNRRVLTSTWLPLPEPRR